MHLPPFRKAEAEFEGNLKKKGYIKKKKKQGKDVYKQKPKGSGIQKRGIIFLGGTKHGGTIQTKSNFSKISEYSAERVHLQ